MKSNTVRANIKAYLRQRANDWVASGELQRVEFKGRDGWAVTPQVVGRTLRSMEENSLVAVKYLGPKHHAHYKYLPDFLQKHYVPVMQRNTDELFSCPSQVIQGLMKKYAHLSLD